MKFDELKFIKNFIKLSHRQGKQEVKAKNEIIFHLKKNNIKFIEQKFYTTVPETKKARVLADNKKIPCLGTSFVSGKIENNHNLISSLVGSEEIKFANINFNPECRSFSQSNFYFYPSVCIKNKDLNSVINSKKINIEVGVNKCRYKSANLLVGNCKNPKTILFAHYDSIGPGAVDNASGTAMLLKLAIENTEILKTNLLVFAGNEELSYDQPVYWGHGYREFEKQNSELIKKCQKVFVVDCVGNDLSNFSQDEELVHLAFPIKNLDLIKKKVHVFCASISKLMQYYHSDLDTEKKVKQKHLNQAHKLLMNKLNY